MHDSYESPLCSRYASKQMQFLFSPQHKFSTWRRLWVALAQAEQQLGLDITDAQIAQMREHIEDIDWETAEAREKEVRHDVMAHVYTYGLACPDAKPIIHLGATSCYVGDNTDLMIMYDALELIREKLVNVIAALAAFADEYKDMPTLGFTHFQPAQLTTVGKRASLWLQDFALDYAELEAALCHRVLLGCKGTTGTQASFLELFDGDGEKVSRLDGMIAEKLGYSEVLPVSGQTYTRKLDYKIVSLLCGIAQSAHKFSNDIRLLQHLKEIEEPFEKGQIGSSAMAYKRNPMRSERIASLSRYVITNSLNPAQTAAEQWFERTLDDSANRRIAIAEAFLATDAVLALVLNVTDGLVVYPKVIASRIDSELPFMATENILMDAVKKGGDRQELHEKIRVLSMQAAKRVKEEGAANDLLERIAAEPAFGLTKSELDGCLDARKYIGVAPQQVSAYLARVKREILVPNKKLLGRKTEINV